MAPLVIHLIPHTHWDREWYLPLGGFRARLVAMVDELLDLLAREPGIPGFLLDGQTALLQDYLAIRPDRRAQVAALVRAGRIGTGPWHILADEQVPAGESLLRNLALGQRDSQALGRSLPVIYSPDAFGHPAALPAIGKEFGLRWAVVWRGLGNEATGGKDLAWWRGPDGDRVLLYHLPPDGYEIGSNLLVGDEALAGAWRRVRDAVLPRAATRHVAVFVGADHHAAPPDLAELPARLAEIDRSVAFRLSRLEDFFAEAERGAAGIATIDGELRWSYGYTWTLQGTLATRARLKRRNSETELRLVRQAEPLTALAGLHATADPAVLRQAWREVVQCHFHDVICGCSNDLVAKAAEVRLDDANAAATELIRASLQRLTGQDPDLARSPAGRSARLAIWNGAARARGGVVVAEATFFVRDVLVGPPGARVPRRGEGFAPFALRDLGSGMSVAPQVLSIEPSLERRDAPRHYPDQDEVERVRFAFPLPMSLPGLGLRVMEPVTETAEPMEEFTGASARRLWNGRVIGTVERTGTIELEEPVSGARYPGLLALESELDRGDSYSFCPVRGDRPVVARQAVRPRVDAAGPLVAALSWRNVLRAGSGSRRGPGRVVAQTTMELVGDGSAIRLRIAVDNQVSDHRLRLRFPTGLRQAAMRAGAQFGWVERPPVRVARGKGEWPVPTAPAHRWVAAASKDRGLALFAPGFFEYQWTRTGDLLVTVLRAVGELSKGDLPSRPGHAGWPTPIPEAQCPGLDVIELGIAPITKDDLAQPAQLERIWEDLFTPPMTVWERDATALPVPPTPGVELEGAGLVYSACLPGAERGELVLRCYNTAEEPVAGAWRFGFPVVRAIRIRADGMPIATLPLDPNTPERVGFSARPREIVTLSVLLALP
jgi:2-O-(6-phospho-alpha-D-mannosyl)-D-glycerate hydrolase